VVNTTAEYLPTLKIKVVHTEVKETSSGIPIGVIESLFTLKTANGQALNLLQKQVFFKSGTGTVYITLGAVKGAKVDLNPDFEKLIESIRLLD
jgi:hypothetical protein